MSYRAIISRWPSRRTLAEDIGAEFKTVQMWHFRDRIPASWWPKLLDAACARGIQIGSQELVAAEEARSHANAPDRAA